MPRLPSLLLLLPAAVLPLVAGCGLLGWRSAGPAPRLSLECSRVTAYTPSALGAVVVIRITNPDAEPVRVGRVRYRLAFPGGPTTRGTLPVHVEIPARAHHEVALPVEIAPDRLRSTSPNGPLPAELPYELEVRATVGPPVFGTTLGLTTTSVFRLDVPLELTAPSRRRGPRFEIARGRWHTERDSRTAGLTLRARTRSND